MKKLFTMFVLILALIFFCPAKNGFSDILKDLQKFTESLGDIVTQIGELSKKISTLEDENENREKQFAEYNQGMANIEAHLKDLDANVERVANMTSLKGVKDIVKSFEGTLDVFKKRFAELANRVEDQEVKTTVLEKMYKTANQPLDSLMQTLNEQNNLIERLEGKLNKQETLIASMKDSVDRQSSLAASLGIEELNARISKLESGASARPPITQKEHTTEKHATTPAGHHEEHVAEEHAAAVPAGHHEEHVSEEHAVARAGHHEAQASEKHVTAPAGHIDKPEATAAKSDLIDIGAGFFIKNIKFKPFGSSSQISGEIMNKSERDYGMMDFNLQAYDMEDIPLGGLRFSIYGFKKGKTGLFEEIIAGVEPERIVKYSIHPAKMPLVSDTGEKTIKIIEKELPAAKTEATEVAVKDTVPENLEDLLFEKATSEKLKGYEDIGSGFYVSGISFSGFGSSSTVTGKIKNNSKDDFYSASFVMKIFSKDYGMITSFDFSIRNINSGETKKFEEIIAGVRPVDIDRHEIAFKGSY